MGIFKNKVNILKLINNNLDSIDINDLNLNEVNYIISYNLSFGVFKELRNLFIFIKNDVNVKYLNKFGYTLYRNICASNIIDFNTKKNIINLLINDFKYNINYHNKSKETVLLSILSTNVSNKYNICKMLIAFGANVNAINIYGLTIFHYYCKYISHDRDYQLLDLLMNHYSLKLNEICSAKYTPLTSICYYQGHNTNLLFYFMEPSIINLKTIMNETPIMLLCEKNSSIESMKYLIDNGANVYIQNENGQNSLDILREKNINKHNELVAYLVEKGLYQ